MTHYDISFAEALALTLNAAGRTAVETVPLNNALHRILSAEILSDVDMPPFDKAAMDGFACRRRDISGRLKVVEEITAGSLPKRSVGPGECARIMTGAPVPDGADCVIKVEDTETEGDIIRFTADRTADNICRKGEDVRTGETVLSTGTRIAPPHIAVLAAVGCATVPVSKAPRVAVLSTGDELVSPGETPTDAQIRNSNGPQLIAQLAAMGISAADLGAAPDNTPTLMQTIEQAAETFQILILSGGVSMGERDLVTDVIGRLGYDVIYHKVTMQPGKPTLFSRNDADRYCIGLPGNPVASLVVFELLIKPFLYKLMGHTYAPRIVSAKLTGGFRRKKIARSATLPVRFIAPNSVALVDYHGSAHIHAMCLADGLITIPQGRREIAEGSSVDVRCL